MKTLRAATIGLAALAVTGMAQTRDDIALPFVDDPAIVGTWEGVDFVQNPDDFVTTKRQFTGDFALKELTFLEGGKTPQEWWTWTKGVLMHHGDQTASHYMVKDIEGTTFMFLEWKSGDYTEKGMKPWFYVLRKR